MTRTLAIWAAVGALALTGCQNGRDEAATSDAVSGAETPAGADTDEAHRFTVTDFDSIDLVGAVDADVRVGDVASVTALGPDRAALVMRQTGRAEGADEEGRIRVFFELNGQPRATRIPKAGLGDTVRARRKADEGNPKHVAAPMPGSVVTVAVKPGQKLAKGAPLLSIEAMMMETAMTADGDLVVKAVHVKPGDVIAVKDLLVEFA